MKTYEVEFRRTSFITITVTAKSAEDAEMLAWYEIEPEYGEFKDADWAIESTKEATSC